MQDTGHPENTSGNTPGCIFSCFLPENPSWIYFVHLYTSHDIIATKMMPSSGRAHPHVYTVQVWSKSDWQFLRYWHFCIPPACPSLTIISHPAPETWPQNWHQCHNNSQPSLPRPQQMPLLVHWQLGWHLSACQCTTGIPKMLTTHSPYFVVPWELAPPQLHSARQWGPPQLCFCSPRHQIPRNACTMDANQQRRGRESNQGKSFCLPWPNPAGNDTLCQHPCASLRTWRDSSQAGRGPPRSHCMHQDTDGLLWDDQWSVLQAQTTLPYHLCILPQGKAPTETYCQALQDTLQWAGWHCCEPFCHATCQGTSLPQLQTCGNNPPGQKADGPYQPQQPWSHTICTLQGLSQLHPTAPSWQSKLPSMWFPLFQMQQNGTLGTKMPWWQATPPKECTSTWATAEEFQMPT